MRHDPVDLPDRFGGAVRERSRPPGTVAWPDLIDLCTSCGDCVAICPQHLIVLDPDGYPIVIGAKACGNCGLCADVCMHGAIEFVKATQDGLKLTLEAERLTADASGSPRPRLV